MSTCVHAPGGFLDEKTLRRRVDARGEFGVERVAPLPARRRRARAERGSVAKRRREVRQHELRRDELGRALHQHAARRRQRGAPRLVADRRVGRDARRRARRARGEETRRRLRRDAQDVRDELARHVRQGARRGYSGDFQRERARPHELWIRRKELLENVGASRVGFAARGSGVAAKARASFFRAFVFVFASARVRGRLRRRLRAALRVDHERHGLPEREDHGIVPVAGVVAAAPAVRAFGAGARGAHGAGVLGEVGNACEERRERPRVARVGDVRRELAQAPRHGFAHGFTVMCVFFFFV
jgi:hypothetical protein